MNAIICGIEVLAVIGILTFAVWALSGRTLRESGAIAFAIVWVASFAALVLTFLIGRGKRGAILLDCGHHPARALFLLNAAIFAILGLSFGVASNTFDTLAIASTLVGIALAVYWLLMSFGRLQIVENGIWSYWSLLKWQKLESYDWQGAANPTLMLKIKTKFPFLGCGALPVPREHKDAVSRLLEQYAVQEDA